VWRHALPRQKAPTINANLVKAGCKLRQLLVALLVVAGGQSRQLLGGRARQHLLLRLELS
jgi:hypothetical protein